MCFIHLQGVFFFVSNIVLNQEVTRTVLVECTTFLFFCLWPVIMSFRSNVFHVLRPLIPSSRPFLSCHPLYVPFVCSRCGFNLASPTTFSIFAYSSSLFLIMLYIRSFLSFPSINRPFLQNFQLHSLILFSLTFSTCYSYLFLHFLQPSVIILFWSFLVVLILVRFKLFINSYGLWFAHHICHCLVGFFYFFSVLTVLTKKLLNLFSLSVYSPSVRFYSLKMFDSYIFSCAASFLSPILLVLSLSRTSILE